MRPQLPPREYIYTAMMARSHQLTHHGGKECDCPSISAQGYRIGDYAEICDYPKLFWKLVSYHNNPRVGIWALVFILRGALCPWRHFDFAPGSTREMSYASMIPLTAMEFLARASE